MSIFCGHQVDQSSPLVNQEELRVAADKLNSIHEREQACYEIEQQNAELTQQSAIWRDVLNLLQITGSVVIAPDGKMSLR